jgi:hypothetical protein
MTTPVPSQPDLQSGFIAKHLAMVFALSLAGFVLGFVTHFGGFNLLGLIAALAPLAAIPGAKPSNRSTILKSIVYSLLLLACIWGLFLLRYINEIGKANWH